MLVTSPRTPSTIPDSNHKSLGTAIPGKIRQRASRACLSCRDLKIKCQPAENENCLRCNREGKTCVFVTSRRGSQNSKNKSDSTRSSRSLDTTTTPIAEVNEPAPKRFKPNDRDKNQNGIDPADDNDDSERNNDNDHVDGDEGDNNEGQNRRTSSENISFSIIQNPSDSINILAQAALDDKVDGNDNCEIADETFKRQIFDEYHYKEKSRSRSLNSENSQSSHEILKHFCLVEKGILTPTTLKTLISTYFIRHHQYMPVLPAYKVFRSDSELCELVENEPLLAITFVIIASRFENENVHEASWNYMTDVIQELVLGIREPTLGAIEALLMLSENVPKLQQIVNHKELNELEERFSWNLVGQAVRMSYYLGLDQKTLLESDESMSEETHRMRFIWTFCHLEERQTSIRFGKAFWTRGPTLCFPGFMGQTKYKTSTTLIPSVDSQDVYSSYTQALIDSTNLMSNIHDLLYPSRDRTISLVHQGDYHKILDEFTMGFATYKITWENKNWDILPLNEIVWASFNYAKLYAYGFAFEAHMKRATERSTGTKLNAQQIFPKTMVASPDAKFIIEAKNAAMEILKSCANNLRTYGAMAYLPARYYGYFGHSAVFSIKLIFTGAVCYTEQKEILDLIAKVIECFCDEFKGLDRYHPLIRCAQQLRIFMQTLWAPDSQKLNLNKNTSAPDINYHPNEQHFEFPVTGDSLTGDIFNLVDNFTFDQFSPNLIDESAEAAVQDLTTYFTNDLNSDVWLTYFNPQNTGSF